MNRFQRIFVRYKTITANLAGSDYSWTILRPDYTVADNTPTIANSGLKFYLEPTQQNLTQDKLPGVEYYSVTGNSNLFSVGDILQPPDSSRIPLTTVVSKPDEGEFLSVKLPKIGSITDSGVDVYTNVYFDFLSANTDGNQEFHTDTSLTDPRRRVVCYVRPGIVEGMNFTDDIGNTWRISLIDYRNNIMVIYEDNSNRN